MLLCSLASLRETPPWRYDIFNIYLQYVIL
jgi:hypothetical protein